MGSGVVEVVARAGIDVVVLESSGEALAAGSARIEKSLGRGVRAEKLTEDEMAATMAAIDFTTDETALADRDLVVEAVVEDETAKLGVFEMDQFFPADDRTALAMRLNGVIASPSFATWIDGPPLEAIDAALAEPAPSAAG